MVKLYKVLATKINYDVEEQDFDDDLTEGQVAKLIEGTKRSLPQALEIECECEIDELAEQVADAISEQTGWLINSFDYEIKQVIE